MAIRSYKDSISRLIACGEIEQATIRRLPARLHQVAVSRILLLNAVRNLYDLRDMRSLRLELLRGDLTGQFSIRINRRYRICFRWDKGDAYDVEIIDYH